MYKQTRYVSGVRRRVMFNPHKSAPLSDILGPAVFLKYQYFMTNTELKIPETNENFEALLNEQFGDKGITGSVVKGTIIRLTPDFAIVDVGLKSEGRIPLREFGQNAELKVGDKVEVYVDRYEDKDGQIVLSREKARREEVWQDLEKCLNSGERVNGVIFGRVKGGFTVDLNGAIAFLPGSQIDIRPIRDITPLMGISQPFQILKMDKVRGNIVVSRRVFWKKPVPKRVPNSLTL